MNSGSLPFGFESKAYPQLAISGLIPDALFEVNQPTYPHQGIWCCLETTMGHRPKLVGEKIHAYLQALQGGHIQYDLNTSYQPRILFYFEEPICHQAVMENLRTNEDFKKYGSSFRFGLFEEVQEDVLNQWKHPGNQGFISLF